MGKCACACASIQVAAFLLKIRRISIRIYN